ncbi:hypothetical protein BaRGS_00022865 [Batillaria attramentaria]|uniref:CUE domain-containing protein n=1 Tax=Batillaria attramentaria TaxID=370345 RepID=A0ABD0KFU5_9CAEN
MAAANIQNLMHLNRLPEGTNLLPLLVYLPLGATLVIVRCFVFAHALLVFFLLSWIPFVQSVVLRVMFAVCGLIVVTDGASQPNQQRLVFVANHVTSLDPFILSLVMHCTVVLDLPACSNDFIHLCKQVKKSADMSKDGVLHHMKKSVEESKVPLLFFPEGGRSNRALGLLKFKSLPFQLDVPIQPSSINSAWWLDLLLCFFVPVTFFRIKFMPVTQCRESENVEQFASRVQTNLAKGLGVATTEISSAELLEAMKNRQHRGQNASQPQPASAIRSSCDSPSLGSTANPAQAQEVVTSTDPALNIMLRQVQEVLPYATGRAVLADLEATRDVDVTITNILEGRVDLQQQPQPPQPSSSQSMMETETFKAAHFPKTAPERQMSLQERKQAMLEAARARYKEKHGIP